MKKNKTIEQANEIMSILDRNYFHINVGFKENGEIEWSIFYKNLTSKAYFSDENKALLTSDKNTVSDIYKLKNKFEEEKHKEYMNNLPEIIKICSTANKGLWKTQKLYMKFSTIILVLIILLTCSNILLIKNSVFSFMMLYTTVIAGTSSIYIQEKISKEIDKTNKLIKEVFIKGKIRRLGIYFIDKIRI